MSLRQGCGPTSTSRRKESMSSRRSSGFTWGGWVTEAAARKMADAIEKEGVVKKDRPPRAPGSAGPSAAGGVRPGGANPHLAMQLLAGGRLLEWPEDYVTMGGPADEGHSRRRVSEPAPWQPGSSPSDGLPPVHGQFTDTGQNATI